MYEFARFLGISPAALFVNSLSLVILCYLILCAAVILSWIGQFCCLFDVIADLVAYAAHKIAVWCKPDHTLSKTHIVVVVNHS